MHGCGNDYIYVNGWTEHIVQEEKAELVKKLSDRHFGIGGDGVIFINPSEQADFEMEMYNADGSRAEMCGNGIRCVGKYVFDKGLTNKTEISVISYGKVKYLQLFQKEGKVEAVRVNMGEPVLAAAEVPVISQNSQVISEDIQVNGKTWRMTCVSMGNPHAVVFVEDTEHFDVEGIGPFFENHRRFPKRTNVEFIQIVDKNHVKMRVWERGTGETLACGTGCSAAVVACILNGLTEEKVQVEVLGGSINIEWNRKENRVYMTGPATTVFEGEVEL